VAEQVRPVAVEQVRSHPRFKYFPEAGEDPYQSFLGVPLIDRGVLQGVLVVQTVEARVFPENEIRLLIEASSQVAPVVSEARTLDRFIVPIQERLWALARNLWRSWDHDSGQLFRDLDPHRWSQLNHSPVSLLNEFPLAKLEARATELQLHSRINYAYRRLREYQESEHTWGARRAGVGEEQRGRLRRSFSGREGSGRHEGRRMGEAGPPAGKGRRGRSREGEDEASPRLQNHRLNRNKRIRCRTGRPGREA
jgi:hypothetical protein